MIARSTDIRSALRSRQRGFFLNPFRFGPAAPDNSAFFDATSTAKTVHALRVAVAEYSGPLVRVRRSSDSAEIDVSALQNGELDVPSLLSFVGAGSGFIVRWYDQKYQGDWVQGVHGNQPVIVNSGVMHTENGKPKIVFLGPQWMLGGYVVSADDSMSLCIATDTIGFCRGTDSQPGYWSIACNPNYIVVIFVRNGLGGYEVYGSAGTTFRGIRAEVNNSVSGSQLRLYQNAVMYEGPVISNSHLRAEPSPLVLGKYYNDGYVNGAVAEIILYTDPASSTAATAIQANWAARFAL